MKDKDIKRYVTKKLKDKDGVPMITITLLTDPLNDIDGEVTHIVTSMEFDPIDGSQVNSSVMRTSAAKIQVKIDRLQTKIDSLNEELLAWDDLKKDVEKVVE